MAGETLQNRISQEEAAKNVWIEGVAGENETENVIMVC